MAESMDETQNSWWGGWLQSAKEKSMAAVDFVKRDLTEFTNTMSQDTTKIVEITSTTIKDTLKAENTTVAKDKVKQSISTLFNELSKALIVPHDDDDGDDSPKLHQTNEGADIFDRSKARLHAIQVDPGTYLSEPNGPEDLFQAWLKEFNMDDKKGHISEVLVTSVEVRALYTKLVPLQISHTDFWQHYFYKLHQLEMDEVRKQAMMKRAEREREDSLGWEDDWSGDEEFEDLSNTDLKPASEPTPKSGCVGTNSSSSVLKPIPEQSTETASPAAECNPTDLSSSNLQPLPERGKETAPDVSQSIKQYEENEVQNKVPAACDNLPSNQNKMIPIKQESSVKEDETLVPIKQEVKQSASSVIEDKTLVPVKQESNPSASSVKEDEKLVSNVNLEQNVQSEEQQQLVVCSAPITMKNNSESQPSLVEVPSVGSATISSVNAAHDASSEPAPSLTRPSDVKPDEAFSPENLSAAERSTDDDSKSQSSQIEVCQQNLLETVAKGLPQKTLEAEKPTVETDPESPPSVLTQRIGENSPLETQMKDEELACAPSGKALDIKTKIKGDMVVVGSDTESPNSDSSGTKEFLHLVPDPSTEDWEHDFDLEVTEDDLKAADEIAKNLGTDLDLQDDDWENWE